MVLYQEDEQSPKQKDSILTKYRKLYNLRKERKEEKDITYNKREYPRRTTEKEKNIERSRFEYRPRKLQRKHFLLIVLMFFMMLFLCEAVSTNKSNYTIGGYVFLFALLFIAFRYDVNSKFYLIFVIIFLIHFSLTKSYNIILPDYELINNKNNIAKKK